MGGKLRQRCRLRLARRWWVCRASRRVGSRNAWHRRI